MRNFILKFENKIKKDIFKNECDVKIFEDYNSLYLRKCAKKQFIKQKEFM